MLPTPNLNSKNVFKIAINESDYLVYAPLNRFATIEKKDTIIKLENNCFNYQDNLPVELISIYNNLLQINSKLKSVNKIDSPDHFERLFILPTNKCNFSCSYCFSAKGRSSEILDTLKLKKALDYFIDPRRIATRYLSISFVGGGEPLVEWETTKFGIEYAAQLADKNNLSLNLSIITNGSLINTEIINIIKKYDVAVTISFEILEEFQNINRGHFEQVKSNLHKLIENEIYTRVRSTITPASVRSQQQMISQLLSEFPEVNDIVFEFVTDSTLNDVNSFRNFHRDFIENFFAAEKIADNYNKKLNCSASMNAEKIMYRYCPGYFVLTPKGEISICTRITAPDEAGYSESIFGKVTNNEIYFNKEKYNWLINEPELTDECNSCFAKFHCAGGCLGQQYVYNKEQMDIVCEFTREFTKQYVLNNLIN